jgi:hypothetical protein
MMMNDVRNDSECQDKSQSITKQYACISQSCMVTEMAIIG